MPCGQRSPIATPADVSRRPTQEIERNELEKLQASAKALQLAAMSYNNGKREFLTEMLGRTNDIVTWSAHFTYRGVSVFAVDGCRASRGSDAEKREALEVLSRILKEIVSS
jgi:hypothetical protein